MAENAANFTLTYQTKPSLFEIIAQKSLNNTLHPGLQKIALVLSTNFPNKFGWLNRYYEEAFLALSSLLQYSYLRHSDASFSENFYGLKRVLGNTDNLRKRQQEISLIFLVVLPYFRRKLDERISMIKIEEAEGCLRKDFDGRLKKLILLIYSSCDLVWGILTVYNYLEYMANKTEFQTPLLRILDMKLTYDVEQQSNTGLWSDLFNRNLNISQLSFGFIKNAITTSLEIGAFFLQFLQTWNTQKSNYNITDLPIVASPQLQHRSHYFRSKCPICLKPWTIPTALQVSGYIFCFRCILRYLNEHQKCPVTNLPAKPLDVVRIYFN